MNEITVRKRALNATKWSTITELLSKLVLPISNMILARILIPEAFGVVAIVSMIITFADMFTDAGFQKYIIQHEFIDDKEKYESTNVAFITNLLISIVFVFLIFLFRNQIALAVGNPNLGFVISISSIQLIFTSFSSIQIALFRRDFDFKTLFLVRVISILVPFVITLPLALLGASYWSIIIGSIVIQVSNAILLTIKSKWKPNFYFRFDVLKKMLSFSIWSLVEAISIWATAWIDIFIIGQALNQYYLGLYRTSQLMVNSLLGLITAAIVPVLFSTLARFQSDDNKFRSTYYSVQLYVSVLAFPLGVGIFLFSDLFTFIILGENWLEASSIIGIWSLTSSLMIVFGYFCSEVYRAKGRPKLSFLAQILHIVILVPTIMISVRFGFWTLVYARSLIRLQFIFVHFIFMRMFFDFKIFDTIRRLSPSILATLVMLGTGLISMQIFHGYIGDIISIIICGVVYVSIISAFPRLRRQLLSIFYRLLPDRVQKLIPNWLISNLNRDM